MPTLVWDAVGERFYQTGIDKGVLFIGEEPGVPWNGLINVEDSSTSELKSFFLDGAKYLENLSPGDFQGKLTAYTYPEEFDSVIGIDKFAPGMSLYEQPTKSFSLTYRTRVGNDEDGTDHGYIIHLLYNLLANSDPYSFQTLDESIKPIEFSWSLTGTPMILAGFRPTVHVTIDSLTTPSDILEAIEDALYGTDETESRLLTLGDVAVMFGYIGALIITDHGDGTWSARDTGGDYITKPTSTSFEIDGAITTVVDADTYTIASTPAP